jgi:tRNA pseudouridine55 synthase
VPDHEDGSYRGIVPLPDGGAWILIDKPVGKTSFDVVAIVRRIIGEKKVGHAGTLDPMATGLLVIGYGKATKLLTGGLAGGKTYEATAKIGLASPTHDTDSEQVVEVASQKFDRARVNSALIQIAERPKQTPPLVSAIKVQGQPLHKVARQGWWLPRDSRAVDMEELTLLDYDEELGELKIRVRGGGGTYVRSIVRDLGINIGVPVALTELRRTGAGQFSVDQAVLIEELPQSWEEFQQDQDTPSDDLTG